MDKNHAHNHIIFCAASFIDHKKLHDDRANMYKIRKISDEICVAHEKSIIKEPDKKKAKSYYEWKQSKKGNSWKDILFENMQSAIKESKSYEEFLQNMSDRGYDYKGEKIGENESVLEIDYKKTDGRVDNKYYKTFEPIRVILSYIEIITPDVKCSLLCINH